MAKSSERRAVLRHAPPKHGHSLHRDVLSNARGGNVSMRVLRQRAVQFGHEIRFGHRVAQFLGAAGRRKYTQTDRYQHVHGARRGILHAMRRTPGTRVRRWTAAYESTLLHERIVAAVHSPGELT